jgi:hypothetical protein
VSPSWPGCCLRLPPPHGQTVATRFSSAPRGAASRRLAPATSRSPAGAGRRLVSFAEVTRLAGLLDGHFWATSAAWADLDGDGYPDLYRPGGGRVRAGRPPVNVPFLGNGTWQDLVGSG